MSKSNLPNDAIDAFLGKCGIGDPFAKNRFSNKLPKPIALARVAIWSAVRDKFKIAYGMTAGQITTVVDAAPAIISPKQMKLLDLVLKEEDLKNIIQDNHAKWWQGISAAAQLWSIRMAAGANVESMKNSIISDRDYAQMALVAWHLESGQIDKKDPTQCWAEIEYGSEVLAQSKTGVGEWIMKAAKEGRWEEITSSYAIGHFKVEELKNMPVLAPAKSNIGLYSFLGLRTPRDYRNIEYSLLQRGENDSFSVAMSKSPIGSYVKIVVDKMGLSKYPAIAEDALRGGLIGYHEAAANYSPVHCGVSKTDVRRVRNFKKRTALENQSCFSWWADNTQKSDEEICDDLGLKEIEEYVPSRFAGYARSTWMNKRILEETSAILNNNDEVDRVKRLIENDALDLQVDTGISHEQAIILASRDLIDKENSYEMNSLASDAMERLRHGKFVHLDATSEDGHSAHERFTIYMDQHSDDEIVTTDELNDKSSYNINIFEGDVDSEPSGYAEIIVKKLEALYTEIKNGGFVEDPTPTQLMENIAKAIPSSKEEFSSFIKAVKETYPSEKLAQSYIAMMGSLRDGVDSAIVKGVFDNYSPEIGTIGQKILSVAIAATSEKTNSRSGI